MVKKFWEGRQPKDHAEYGSHEKSNLHARNKRGRSSIDLINTDSEVEKSSSTRTCRDRRRQPKARPCPCIGCRGSSSPGCVPSGSVRGSGCPLASSGSGCPPGSPGSGGSIWFSLAQRMCRWVARRRRRSERRLPRREAGTAWVPPGLGGEAEELHEEGVWGLEGDAEGRGGRGLGGGDGDEAWEVATATRPWSSRGAARFRRRRRRERCGRTNREGEKRRVRGDGS